MTTKDELQAYFLENYFGEGDPMEALLAFYENSPGYFATLDAEDIVSEFKDSYVGNYENLEAWADEYLNDSGLLQGDPFLVQYFDYDAWLRDAQLGGEIWTENAEDGSAFVFRSI